MRVLVQRTTHMGTSGITHTEVGPILASEQDGWSSQLQSGVGILVADATNRRLVEGAALQIGLSATTVERTELATASLADFELIVVDEPFASDVRQALLERERRGGGINPSVIAVHASETESAPKDPKPSLPKPAGAVLDGVLALPMQPAALAAQLSLILYAHRAFAQRYKSAFEELHLNRRIFRSVTSGISVADATRPDLPLVYVNPAFEVMTGYCLEEVEGKNCRFLQGSYRDQPGVTLLREALREQREVTAIMKNFRKDGSAFWNELSLSPIRNREGELTHVVGIQTDVTARVEFEAALRESEKLAAVGRLASSIAHEINNPLEAVTNLLYLARTAEDTGETMRYLGMADKELQRVAQITSQSLRFYKQSSKPQAISVAEMIHSVMDLYESRADNSQVAIERRDRSMELVVCLESEIRQVLNNLVRNAIEAMHGRGGRLLIRSRDATDARTGVRGVVMTIADTGSGISASTRHNLFKPFFTTKGLAGTGLGLWVSAEIVTRHQGRLTMRSSQRPESSGTIFRLFLPLQPSAAA